MLARYLIYGAFALVVAVQAQATPAPLHAQMVELTVFPDGSVRVEGHRYATVDAAKAELLAISKREPPPEISFVVARDVPVSTIGRLIQLLQAAGVAKIEFLTEPENIKKPTH